MYVINQSRLLGLDFPRLINFYCYSTRVRYILSFFTFIFKCSIIEKNADVID
jgi:hypothetical protein